MRIVLSVFGVIALVVGFVIFAGAKSAVHEIEGLICVVISAVCIGSAVITSAVMRLAGERDSVEAAMANDAPPMQPSALYPSGQPVDQR